MPYPLSKRPYQAEAELLAKTVAERGHPMRHHEILTAVAKNHGAETWRALASRKSWVRRLGDLVLCRRSASALTPYSEILYGPAHSEWLRLGTSVRTGAHFEVEYDFLRRHVLLLGQAGVGMRVLQHYLVHQHMARGGGFLFLDELSSPSERVALEEGARRTGTPFVRLDTRTGASTKFGLREAVLEKAAVYVSVSPLEEKTQRTAAMQALLNELRAFLVERIELQGIRPREKEKSPPFLVFVPSISCLPVETFSVLLQHARACGILFIFSDDKLPLQPGGAWINPLADSVLQHTWTKVFFRQSSPLIARTAAEMLGAYESTAKKVLRPGEVSMQEALVKLGLGEAIAMSGNFIERIKVPMVWPGAD